MLHALSNLFVHPTADVMASKLNRYDMDNIINKMAQRAKSEENLKQKTPENTKSVKSTSECNIYEMRKTSLQIKNIIELGLSLDKN